MSRHDRKPIAFIVQRYGAEVDGGAELHCRWIATKLAERRAVEVLTTCALSYITWANHYPPGVSRVDGVTLRRFPTDEERDRASFDDLTGRLLAAEHSDEQETDWLRKQGPYCPQLLEYLRREHGRYEVLIFYTYLYYPTAAGLAVAPHKSVLASTAHDEPVIRFRLFRKVFLAPRAFLFLTDAERQFVHERFENAHIPWLLLGTGIELAAGSEESFREAFAVKVPYLLYTGRIDAGKGCLEICDYFLELKRRLPGDLQLLFLGKLHDRLPSHPDIRYLGFVSDSEKAGAIRGARALIAPSRFESLGISALEAMAAGVPIVVNGASAVLKSHCLASNGGLWYENQEEFVEVTRQILVSERLRTLLGANGVRYIQQRYAWARVVDGLEALIETLTQPAVEPHVEPGS